VAPSQAPESGGRRWRPSSRLSVEALIVTSPLPAVRVVAEGADVIGRETARDNSEAVIVCGRR
jgi:hypothetical protein